MNAFEVSKKYEYLDVPSPVWTNLAVGKIDQRDGIEVGRLERLGEEYEIEWLE